MPKNPAAKSAAVLKPAATKRPAAAALTASGRRARQKDVAGLRNAHKKTTMTRENWKKLQVGMAEKWPVPEHMKVPHPEGKGGTAYRDKTFEIMTRMKEDTVISYRPYAKAPGTTKTPNKSHVRYIEYHESTTAGTALANGAWPADWCWDYERGFLRIDRDTLREDPIDITQLPDNLAAELTPVDNAVYAWYRKELCRKLGLTLEDLQLEAGGQESTMMRAHRLVAQRESVAVLAECEKQRRPVRDEELTSILDKWGFAKNPNRHNVMKEGQKYVFSDTLGLLVDRLGDIHCTKGALRYPEVIRVMNKWLSDRLPDEAKSFAWTSLNVNKNYAATVHRDGNNFGASMISAFGTFTGGGLNYFPTDDGTGDPAKLVKEGWEKQSFDLKKGVALFNGNNGHCVDDFVGSRYTIVYFTLGNHAKMPDTARHDLIERGFIVPGKEQEPFELLRPSGKKRKVASPVNSCLPASRYWTKEQLLAR